MFVCLILVLGTDPKTLHAHMGAQNSLLLNQNLNLVYFGENWGSPWLAKIRYIG